MSAAVLQFIEIIQSEFSRLEQTLTVRECLVCEARTRQVAEQLPSWVQWRCLDCGFRESVQRGEQ